MHASRSSEHRRLAATVLLAAPALALALAACSPAASPSAGDTSAGSKPAGSPSAGPAGNLSEDDFSAARDAYDLALAQCIREQGVDVRDPRPGEGFQESGPEVQAAASTCMAELGPPPTYDFTEEDRLAMREQQLALAECLRGLGYDVADPAPDTAIAIQGVPDADFAACESAE